MAALSLQPTSPNNIQELPGNTRQQVREYPFLPSSSKLYQAQYGRQLSGNVCVTSREEPEYLASGLQAFIYYGTHIFACLCFYNNEKNTDAVGMLACVTGQ